MKLRGPYLPYRLIAAVVMAVIFAGCADISDEARLAEVEVRDSMPTQEFDDVTMIQTKDGVTQFVLEAPRLERYDKLDQALLYGGITITFYEDEEVSSVITADRGEVKQGGNALRAIGNVVVKTDTGATILSPRMEWSRDTREIVSDTIVTIITDQDTIRGTGLIASDDLRMRQVIEPTGISYRTVNKTVQAEDSTAEPPSELADTLNPEPAMPDTVEVDSASSGQGAEGS